MGSAPAGRCAVPMLLSRMNHHGVSFADVMWCLAPFLHAHAAFDDEEPLRSGMDVPMGSAVAVELDAIHVHGYGDVIGREPLRPRGSAERAGVGRCEPSRVAAKDLHGSVSPTASLLLHRDVRTRIRNESLGIRHLHLRQRRLIHYVVLAD